MIEIVFQGRGGHGAVMAAEVTAIAAYNAGMHSQAFPFFGGERRGAPVRSFVRIDNLPILLHSQIYKPDILVVLDSELLHIARNEVPASNIKSNGLLLVNEDNEEDAKKDTSALGINGAKIAFVNATKIATDLNLVVAGWPVINTAMLGALVKASGIVPFENLQAAIRQYWPGEIGEKNVNAASQGYALAKFLGEPNA
ncbi:MAG: 2-oxoacid:acceptor oxidoreductase family protein [Candidatus Micrarchaeia archaeon]